MPKPYAVLRYLIEHPGHLVTHEQLLSAIWPDTYVQPEVLRRYILEIRRALGDAPDAPRFIQTIPKRGYRFLPPIVDDSIPAADDGAGVTTLVGRDSALADLHRYLTASSNGRRQFVFVVGEPGIGKTSLVDAFQRACASIAGVTVARGQSVEGFGGKEAYYPLLEAVGQLAHGPARATVLDTLASAAPTWLVQFPSLIRPEQHADLQRAIVGATRERMVREFCQAIEITTRSLTLVLILEDLHWVDHPTLDVLSAVARRREPAKLLVLATLRQADLILSESPLKPLKHDLLLHGLSQELQLERLEEADVETYVAAAYGPGPAAALASVIYRHSEGNPLFMVAMLDHLAKRGILSQADGRWSITRPLGHADPEVPETLKQMLDMQLQNLSAAELQLLATASVVGEQFSVWAVTTMLHGDAVRLEETCEALAARQQFLRVAGTRDVGDGEFTAEYRFTHALYREVLQRRLTPTRRLMMHRRLAAGLAQLRSPAETETAAEIALHFEDGREYGQAIRFLMLAAQNATRRYAHQQAVNVLEHARSLVADLPEAQQPALDLQLLERIGNAYYAMGDMAQSARTYEAMAVRAAGAGLLAAHADTLMRLPHPAELAPFFLKAIELEPDFVAAYVTLSRIYSNLGEAERAKAFARLAYERRDRASEHDRLSLTYQYHFEVTGDQTQATATLETWKRAFPSEFQPVNSLALLHNFLGDFDRGVEEGQEAVRRNALHGYPYSNLAHAYRGLGRYDDAKRTAEAAVALQIETLPTRRLLYQLAVISGERAAADEHRQWARDKPREFDMISAQAQVAGWAGKVGESRVLYQHAARLAGRRNLPDVGTMHLSWGLSMELAYGNVVLAEGLARRILARQPSYDPALRAAMALAATGSSDEAEAIAAELAAANPDHTFINAVLVPMVRGAAALARHEPARAIDALAAVAPFELGFIAALGPIYLRAQAYLALRDGPHAAAQFRRILAHRGSDPFSPYHAVAPLGLARALALSGEIAASRDAYEQFLSGWDGADPDVPVLIEAAEELRDV